MSERLNKPNPDTDITHQELLQAIERMSPEEQALFHQEYQKSQRKDATEIIEAIDAYIDGLRNNRYITEPHPTKPELILLLFREGLKTGSDVDFEKIVSLYGDNDRKLSEKLASNDISKLNKKINKQLDLHLKRSSKYSIHTTE